MPTAVLSDGTAIDFTIEGQGAPLLLSVSTADPAPELIDEFHQLGLDPYPGRNLITMLAPHARVISFDYETHILQHPRPSTFTVDGFARDVLAIASAAGADRFAYYGYSWLALAGPHLAATSQRLTALAMGGFPATEAPLADLVKIARRNHRAAVASHTAGSGSAGRGAQTSARYSGSAFAATTSDPPEPPASVMKVAQARQFVTFFADALRKRASTDQASVEPGPRRLCFIGSQDTLPTGDSQSLITLAEPVVKHRLALEEAGWTVRLLPGLDALEAMQPITVAALLIPWLASTQTDTTAATTTGYHRRKSAQQPENNQRLARAHDVSRDRVSDYLHKCGVAEEWFDDEQLRAAVRNLLQFHEATQGRAQWREIHEGIDRRTGHGVTKPRRDPGVAPSAVGTQVASNSDSLMIDEHHVELLEVAIIQRLRELGMHQNTPAIDECQMNRLLREAGCTAQSGGSD